jgi:hypothetical protein
MATVTGLVLILVSTVMLVRRVRLFRMHSVEEWLENQASDTGPVLWMEPDFGEFLRGIGPSVAAAIFAEVGIAALAGGSPVNAGLMLAAAVAVPAWRWPMADRTGRKSGWSAEAALAAVLLIMTANWIAHPALETGMPRVPSVPSLEASNTRADLSGVILTLPIKSREKVLPLLSITRDGQVTMAMRPVRIEFNGVYWYFKAPDPRPRRDAKVVRGDPMRERIRSTNAIPIQMEAHQPLPEHTLMNRYQEIVLRMRDGDNLPGLVRVNLLLKCEKGTEPMLQGTQVLESSRTRHGYGNRPAVEEELRFPVLATARGRDWTELVVRVEPERARARAGAHVAVVDFLLKP